MLYRKIALPLLSFLALTGLATTGHAAPTECKIWPDDGTTTYDAKIAVASNFYEPAKDMILDFTTGTSLHINVCQNSTGALYNEIITGSAGYSLFLAADTARPNLLVGTTYIQSGATVQLYALGIPVLFGLYNSSTLPDTHTLIPALPSGHRASDIATQVSSAQLISSTNAATVAVADVSAAPYGTAAQSILADMGVTVNNTTIPTWIHSPLYANIDLTYQSVAGTSPPNKSGFVSKAQVCDGSGHIDTSLFVGIEFKYNGGTSSDYLPYQSGILTTSNNSSQDAIGASIFSFMLSNSDPTYWSDFLVAHCYEQIPATAKVFATKHTPKHKYKNHHHH